MVFSMFASDQSALTTKMTRLQNDALLQPHQQWSTFRARGSALLYQPAHEDLMKVNTEQQYVS
jgi:hypothetical protein